jgi:hypothetical protein
MKYIAINAINEINTGKLRCTSGCILGDIVSNIVIKGPKIQEIRAAETHNTINVGHKNLISDNRLFHNNLKPSNTHVVVPRGLILSLFTSLFSIIFADL